MAEGGGTFGGDATASSPTQGGAGGKTGGPAGVGGIVGAVGLGDIASDQDQLKSEAASENQILVQSIGANFGEIAAPFIQGAPNNGGTPFAFPGADLTRNLGLGITTPLGSASVPGSVLLIGGAAVVVVLLLMRRRGRA